MSLRNWKVTLLFAIVILLSYDTTAQENEQSESIEDLESKISSFGPLVRGKTAFTAGIGMGVMNGDLPEAQFDIYFNAGFKQFLGDYVNISLTYHKFNLVFMDTFNEGFMSFDLNLETYFAPYRTFTPFIFAGAGLHAANGFEQTEFKAQAGLGFEVLVDKSIGIKLFADYNQVFSDLVEGIEFGDSDDVYWRIGTGLTFYFGKPLENKVAKEIPTVKDSLILDEDN